MRRASAPPWNGRDGIATLTEGFSGLFLGFDEVVEAFDIITGLLLAIMISGLIILMVSIVIEQRRDMKKMREEISKEDLKP